MTFLEEKGRKGYSKVDASWIQNFKIECWIIKKIRVNLLTGYK